MCVRCLMEQGALSVGLALTIGAAVGVLETFGEQQAVLRAVSAFRCFRRSPTPTPRRRKKQGRPSVVHNGLTGKRSMLFRQPHEHPCGAGARLRRGVMCCPPGRARWPRGSSFSAKRQSSCGAKSCGAGEKVPTRVCPVWLRVPLGAAPIRTGRTRADEEKKSRHPHGARETKWRKRAPDADSEASGVCRHASEDHSLRNLIFNRFERLSEAVSRGFDDPRTPTRNSRPTWS